MVTIKEFNRCGEELEKILLLKTSPIAVKMLTKKADIPAGALRPRRDRKYHLAQCQAFAMTRRERATIAMLKEDHWCPAALMAYGMVPVKGPVMGHPYERFEYGKYIGILTAPLKSVTFKPDVVIVYSNSAQLRTVMLSMPIEQVSEVEGRFFPPSCAHAVVAPMMTGKFFVVIPDPGEYQRAHADDNEIMLAIPAEKLAGLLTNLKKFQDQPYAYRNTSYFIQGDFPRPDFYKMMFKQWGLEDY